MICRYELIPFSDDVIVTTQCPVCHAYNEMKVNHDALDKFIYHGALIQNVFPDLSPEDRERLITGICPDCWTNTFGGDEE